MSHMNFSSFGTCSLHKELTGQIDRLFYLFIFFKFLLACTEFCHEIDFHVAPFGMPEAAGGSELSDIMSAAWGYSVSVQSP